MQYVKVEPSRLPTTNIFYQSFNIQIQTQHNNTWGCLADKFKISTQQQNIIAILIKQSQKIAVIPCFEWNFTHHKLQTELVSLFLIKVTIKQLSGG